MNLLLDTHALLWWRDDPGRLSAEQRELLDHVEAEGGTFAISAITLWELAKLAELGRIKLNRALDLVFDDLEQHSRLTILPLTPRVALESTRLGPDFPRDPADQVIVATARVHGLRLVTADRKIRKSKVVSVV